LAKGDDRPIGEWKNRTIPLNDKMREGIRIYRHMRMLASEAEAIRELIQIGLDSAKIDATSVPPPRPAAKRPAK
jgi:hypothetical protein